MVYPSHLVSFPKSKIDTWYKTLLFCGMNENSTVDSVWNFEKGYWGMFKVDGKVNVLY